MPSLNELLAALTMGAGSAGEQYLKFKGKEQDTKEDIARAMAVEQQKLLMEKESGEFDLNRRLKEAQIAAMGKGGYGGQPKDLEIIIQGTAEADWDDLTPDEKVKTNRGEFIAQKKRKLLKDFFQKRTFIKDDGEVNPYDETSGAYTPEQEKLILDNMTAYGKSREEIVNALKAKGLL